MQSRKDVALPPESWPLSFLCPLTALATLTTQSRQEDWHPGGFLETPVSSKNAFGNVTWYLLGFSQRLHVDNTACLVTGTTSPPRELFPWLTGGLLSLPGSPLT